MLMADIGSHGVAYVGDEVVLIGKQGTNEITLMSVAKKCQTITYEILCGFNERIPRIYV
jgi:alanine racemase